MKESIKKKFDSIDKSKIKVESTKEFLGKLEKGLNSKTQENADKAEALLDKFIAQAKAKNADIFVSNKPAPTLTPTAKKKANQVVKSKLDSLMDTIANDPLLKDFNNSRRTKGGGKSDPLIDSERKAIQSGPRVSKQGWKNQYGKSTGGRKYYEYRENRIDRKAPNYGSRPWLKEGGFIHPSDANAEKYVVVEIKADGSRREHNNFGDLETARMFASLKREFLPKGSQLMIEDKNGKNLYRSFKSGGYMANGGMMGDGGSIKDIKIGSKIGFLRPNTGRYEYAEVLSMDNEKINLVVRHPKRSQLDNYFTETKERIRQFIKQPSEDWKDGRMLVKIKYADGGYMADGGELTEKDYEMAFAPRYLDGQDFEKISDNINKEYLAKDRKSGVHDKFTKYWYNGGREEAIAKYGEDENQAWQEAYEDFKDDYYKMAKGGYVDIEAQLIKELQKLQRDLNSDRLSTYKEGDNSDEEKARKRERESKLVRFNEILELLHEIQAKKMEHGGKIDESTAMVLSQNKAIAHHTEELKKAIAKNKKVEPWVIGKMQRATTDMSDVTHYFDGMTEYAKGGYLKDELPYDNAVYKYLEGKDLLIYSMGVKQPMNYKIKNVIPPNPRYSIPTLVVELTLGEERIEGVEKIKKFVSGEQVELYDGKEYYAIQLASMAKPKTPTGNYTNRRNLKLIVIKNPNKSGSNNVLTIDKKDFLDGLHKLEDGGSLSKDYTYIKRADVNQVAYYDKSGKLQVEFNPKNGFWVSKKALVDAGMNETKAKFDKNKVANELIALSNKAWDKLSIQSGSEIYASDTLQQDLADEYQYLGINKIYKQLTKAERKKVSDVLTDENEHSLRNYLALRGYNGEAEYKNYVKMFEEGKVKYGHTSNWNPKNVDLPIVQFAKGGSISDGGKLPEDMGRYFIKTSKTKVVNMSDLIPLRKRATGIVNAEKNMKMAYDGEMDKRKPITIYKSQGKYRIMDGNSTYAVAKANGWENIWAEIVKNPNMNTYEKRGNDLFTRAKKIRKEGESWNDAIQRAKAMK
jgi:hypothetical protein